MKEDYVLLHVVTIFLPHDYNLNLHKNITFLKYIELVANFSIYIYSNFTS